MTCQEEFRIHLNGSDGKLFRIVQSQRFTNTALICAIDKDNENTTVRIDKVRAAEIAAWLTAFANS